MKEEHQKYIVKEALKTMDTTTINMIKRGVLDKETEVIQAIENDNAGGLKKVLIAMKNDIERALKRM